MKQLILGLLFFSATTYAQDGRYSLRTHVGYGLSNRMTTGGSPDFRSTFNAGIEVQRKMGQRGFYLKSGIRWNEFGFCDLITSYLWNGAAYVGHVDYYKSTHFYLSIPVIATWKLNNGFTISTGPQLSFSVLRKTKTDQHIEFYNGDTPPLQYSGYFALGYERKISDRWIIGGEAYTNSVIPDGFYNFGIGVSLNYIL